VIVIADERRLSAKNAKDAKKSGWELPRGSAHVHRDRAMPRFAAHRDCAHPLSTESISSSWLSFASFASFAEEMLFPKAPGRSVIGVLSHA